MPGRTHPWDAELARLESEVEAAEALLASLTTDGGSTEVDTSSWTATPGLGPLPQHLVPRAEALLARQRQVQVSLSLALQATTRQRDFTARVNDATSARPAPTYLDVTA